jgi:hypothetical protein
MDVLLAPLPKSLMLSAEDLELLTTYLTAPYIRMPLVVAFFDKRRLGALCNGDAQVSRAWPLLLPSRRDDVLLEVVAVSAAGCARVVSPAIVTCRHVVDAQRLLERVLFEPRSVVLDEADLEVARNTYPTIPVPKSRSEVFSTSFGMLLNELHHSCSAIVEPLCDTAVAVADLCCGDYSSSFANVLLFMNVVLARLEGFIVASVQRPADLRTPSSQLPALEHGLQRLRGVTLVRLLLPFRFVFCWFVFCRFVFCRVMSCPVVCVLPRLVAPCRAFLMPHFSTVAGRRGLTQGKIVPVLRRYVRDSLAANDVDAATKFYSHVAIALGHTDLALETASLFLESAAFVMAWYCKKADMVPRPARWPGFSFYGRQQPGATPAWGVCRGAVVRETEIVMPWRVVKVEAVASIATTCVWCMCVCSRLFRR